MVHSRMDSWRIRSIAGHKKNIIIVVWKPSITTILTIVLVIRAEHNHCGLDVVTHCCTEDTEVIRVSYRCVFRYAIVFTVRRSVVASCYG